MFSSRSSLLSRATQVALKRYLPISNFRLAVSPGQKQPQQHRCRSTMRAPSVRRREREAGSNPTSDLLFNQSDVPILNFWQDYATSRISEGPTAEVLLNTALQYCTVAVRNNSTWKGALQRGISGPQTLCQLKGVEANKTLQITTLTATLSTMLPFP